MIYLAQHSNCHGDDPTLRPVANGQEGGRSKPRKCTGSQVRGHDFLITKTTGLEASIDRRPRWGVQWHGPRSDPMPQCIGGTNQPVTKKDGHLSPATALVRPIQTAASATTATTGGSRAAVAPPPWPSGLGLCGLCGLLLGHPAAALLLTAFCAAAFFLAAFRAAAQASRVSRPPWPQ